MDRRIVLLALTIVVSTLLIRASSNVISTTLPILARYSLGFSSLGVGALSAIFTVTTFVGSAFLVRYSSRPVFLSSILLYSLSLALLSKVSSSTVWIVTGTSGGALGLIMPNLITISGKEEERRTRERLLNVYALSLSIGLVVGPLLEAKLLPVLGVRGVFLGFALAPLVALPLLSTARISSSSGRTRIVGNPALTVAILNIASYELIFSFLLTFGGIYMKERFGSTLSEVEIGFSLFFLASLLTRLIMSIYPVERVKRGVTLSLCLTVTGIVIMILSRSLVEFLVTLAVLGVPHGITMPLSTVAITRRVPPEMRSMANGIFFASLTMIGSATSFVSGIGITFLGFQGVLLAILALVMAIGVILMRKVGIVDE
ncbi:MFS transporter [Metallosphaera javensis (ex Sakai et al. 2022)]|uniref:MFS transporter n=1 Tax=Metallosphaera javensis (ex Sakai et al. 2022) TaxID=2775498 RepID=UPI00258B52D8|nr:MAG: hypothetical protein MjAS7_2296 [Metallosphaera javensis (ex Sakai et al. 2022)]